MSSDYDDLKLVSDAITDELMLDERVTGATSTLANSAPLIQIDIDPVKAAAEGFNAAQVSSSCIRSWAEAMWIPWMWTA